MSWLTISLQRTFALARGSAVLGLSLVLPVWTASAQTAGSPRRILEVNVTGDPTRDNGQPVVAVNPRDPDNLVFISTDHRPGAPQGAAGDKWHCLAAYSLDGGTTWSEVPWPYGDRTLCGDPYLGVDSEGIFYTGYNRLGCPPGVPNPTGAISTCNGVPNHLGVARSLDGGRTWSDPVDTPPTVGGTPRLRVDAATGRVYGVGALSGISSPAAVSVSADQGLTWSPSAELPRQPFGNQIAVHDGILATATAMQIIGGTQTAPADPIFFVSFDDGQTFTSFPVTDSDGNPVPPPQGPLVPVPGNAATTDPIPWISADPTQSGRFAILLPRGADFEVYITGDAGQTWSGPTVIAAPGAAKPWIEYGSTGFLGVMWRTTAVDAYSVVSFDRGRSFSPPLRVNATTHSPNVNVQGDEWSRILLDGRYAYITWSDVRSGLGIDGIMSRVPVSLYNCGRGSPLDPPDPLGCQPQF